MPDDKNHDTDHPGPAARDDGGTARIPDPLDLVLFDCDGVLVDSEDLSCRMAMELLQEHGFPVTFEECRAAFTGQTAGIVRPTIEKRYGRPLDPGFEAARDARLYAAFREQLRSFDGIEDLLGALEGAGIPYCVASNGSHGRIRAALGATRLLPRFEGRMFSGFEDVSHGKPAPDLFLHAAAVARARPERCLVVEDSPPGIAAALAAGMTVWAAVGTYDAERLAGAHRIVESVPLLARELRVAVLQGAKVLPRA